MFRDRGVTRLFMKRLAPNDNSKNQIYLGGDFAVLGVLPSGELERAPSSSEKRGSGRQILKASLNLTWLDATGGRHPAPQAQLILYPQYPEVRLSGLLQGSGAPIGQWLDPRRDGRAPGRVLLLGVSPGGEVTGFLSAPNSGIESELAEMREAERFGALTELVIQRANTLDQLLAEVQRIHELGWIAAKRLVAPGSSVVCRGQNCGGYTLEAELGVLPNGLAEPDFLGWEIKTFSVKTFTSTKSSVITVMTPEPDGGLYCDKGPEYFIRRYGYADRKGRPDRINFGGVHRYGHEHALTKLRLALTGFDAYKGKVVDVEGGIELTDGKECAASWSHRKLIEHWKKKHEKAAYIPNLARAGTPRSYHFANSIGLGEGADFSRTLEAILRGELYYDPGLKMEGASSTSPRLKRRNQFRIKYPHVEKLYAKFRHASYSDG